MDAWDVVVVGAGAAGLVAAERAAQRGRRTLLLEKNGRPGIKILMSGGTRCNLTQATDRRGIVEAFGAAGSFLHSALAALPPQALVALVEDEGAPTKIEPTGKIFPVSDRAEDILEAFLTRLRRSDCTLALNEPLAEIARAAEGFRLTTRRREIAAAKVVVTSGGRSYPGSGTTGDGYAWAAALGHTIVPPRPALTPITSGDAWVAELTGVTIPDVSLRVVEPAEGATNGSNASAPRILDRRRGSLLFAHFGLSGPAALDISRAIGGHARPQSLRLECDFLPDVKEPAVDELLRQSAATAGKRQLASLVPEAIPRRLADALIQRADLDPTARAAELSKAGRARLARTLKRAEISISGTRGFKKAEVTAGGVSLDEVDSRTMQSKLVPGLYFAGEVLDLDGPIGGYNFQAAFSTGWLAGESV